MKNKIQSPLLQVQKGYRPQLDSSCICLHRGSLCVWWFDFIFKLSTARIFSEI